MLSFAFRWLDDELWYGSYDSIFESYSGLCSNFVRLEISTIGTELSWMRFRFHLRLMYGIVGRRGKRGGHILVRIAVQYHIVCPCNFVLQDIRGRHKSTVLGWVEGILEHLALQLPSRTSGAGYHSILQGAFRRPHHLLRLSYPHRPGCLVGLWR